MDALALLRSLPWTERRRCGFSRSVSVSDLRLGSTASAAAAGGAGSAQVAAVPCAAAAAASGPGLVGGDLLGQHARQRRRSQ